MNMSMKEYFEIYKPELEDGEPKQFQEYKDAIDYVTKNYKADLPYRHVWSATDSGGDSDYYFMCNGRHLCNVLHYEVCETPWGSSNHEANGAIIIVAEERE
jgi:hypothetical protein